MVIICAVLGAAGGGAYWWATRPPGLPPGFAFSNGRLEADQINVDTKFVGRVSDILADEGSMVRQGQGVARIDTRDLQVLLAQARSQVAQAQQMVVQNAADLVQMSSQLKLTVQELRRDRILAERGDETRQVLDRRQSQFDVAMAAYHNTEAKIAAATASVTFLAIRNEFTPKTVETQSERDKLMFRVRVRIDPALLRAHEAAVRSGLPGLAYIRLDATPWPAALKPVIVK